MTASSDMSAGSSMAEPSVDNRKVSGSSPLPRTTPVWVDVRELRHATDSSHLVVQWWKARCGCGQPATVRFQMIFKNGKTESVWYCKKHNEEFQREYQEWRQKVKALTLNSDREHVKRREFYANNYKSIGWKKLLNPKKHRRPPRSERLRMVDVHHIPGCHPSRSQSGVHNKLR